MPGRIRTSIETKRVVVTGYMVTRGVARLARLVANGALRDGAGVPRFIRNLLCARSRALSLGHRGSGGS